MMLRLYAFPALIFQVSDNNPLTTVVFVMFLTACFALTVGVIVSMWKTFEKAGQPGWGVLIPIYNVYLMTQIARRPGWWTILMLIPLVNIVFHIIISIAMAENFGKSSIFGLGLMFLPFIFFPILGFGDAVYQGNVNFR